MKAWKSLETTLADDGLATLWLARPERRNAMDDTVIAELHQAIDEMGADPRVRVLVLAGRGTAFCAGGDLNWMLQMAEYDDARNVADAERLAAMLHALYTCPKPTIARVHGAAFAGGMGLAAACDIVVAASEAEFCLSEVRIGLVPATISPYVVRALGAHQARRYMLTAERLAAPQAHRLGFVHELCQIDEIDTTVERLARHLSAAGPQALAITKQLLDEVAGRAIDATLMMHTATLIAQVRASAEGREGVGAFLGKRAPAWTQSGDKP